MSGNSKHIKSPNQIYLSITAGIKYCLVLLFAFAFSLQQFSAFAYTQLAENSIKENGSHFYSQNIYSGNGLSYHLPFVPNPLEWEMEIIEEDDEHGHRKLSADYCSTHFGRTFSSNESLYNSSLNCRYLQRSFAADSRWTIPFFVLYHSWKSYLS